MSGQLSMDVGRWFGSGPRYVSPAAACTLHGLLLASMRMVHHGLWKAHAEQAALTCSWRDLAACVGSYS